MQLTVADCFKRVIFSRFEKNIFVLNFVVSIQCLDVFRITEADPQWSNWLISDFFIVDITKG